MEVAIIQCHVFVSIEKSIATFEYITLDPLRFPHVSYDGITCLRSLDKHPETLYLFL